MPGTNDSNPFASRMPLGLRNSMHASQVKNTPLLYMQVEEGSGKGARGLPVLQAGALNV